MSYGIKGFHRYILYAPLSWLANVLTAVDAMFLALVRP